MALISNQQLVTEQQLSGGVETGWKNAANPGRSTEGCVRCAHSHTLTHVVQTVGPDAGDEHRQEEGTLRPWLPSAGTCGLGEGTLFTPLERHEAQRMVSLLQLRP